MPDIGGMSVVLRGKSSEILQRANPSYFGYSTGVDRNDLEQLWERVKRRKAILGSFAEIERRGHLKSGALGNLRRAVENGGPIPKAGTLRKIEQGLGDEAIITTGGGDGPDDKMLARLEAECKAEYEQRMHSIQVLRTMLRERRG